jgi:hypothetical protein
MINTTAKLITEAYIKHESHKHMLAVDALIKE